MSKNKQMKVRVHRFPNQRCSECGSEFKLTCRTCTTNLIKGYTDSVIDLYKKIKLIEEELEQNRLYVNRLRELIHLDPIIDNKADKPKDKPKGDRPS